MAADTTLSDRDSPDGYPIDFSTKRGPDLLILLPGTTQEVQISGYWTSANTKEVELPKRLTCKVAGLFITKKDTMIEGGKKGFQKVMRDRMDVNQMSSREVTGVFTSQLQVGNELVFFLHPYSS